MSVKLLNRASFKLNRGQLRCAVGDRNLSSGRSLTLKILLLLTLGIVGGFPLAKPILAQNSKNLQTSQSDRHNTRIVELSLNDIVQLVVENNRTLKNNRLNRIIEKQQLIEAESKFTPTITPNFSVSVRENLTSNSSFDSETDGLENDSDTGSNFDDDFDEDNIDSSLQIGASLLTPLGTNITLTADPLADFNKVQLEVRQPIIRGAGTKVNRASVKSARLTDTKRILDLKQSLINEITGAIRAYRSLIEAQEGVEIQQNSLNSRLRDLEVQRALVEAGRRSRADLVQQEASVAAAEEQLLNAFNTLSQANSDVLEVIDIDENLKIVIPEKSIEALRDENLLRRVDLNREDLLQTAYQQRPDYLQAKLDVEIAQIDLIEPQDDRRLKLDFVNELSLGDGSQLTAGVELTRTFEDQSLKTAFESARTQLLQSQNNLADIIETIEIEITDRVNDVNSNFAAIPKARQARELAQQRLEIVQELYRRGRNGVDIFQVTSQQDAVVEAQNTELNAIINYLNARTNLEQSLGTTLDTWQNLIRLVF